MRVSLRDGTVGNLGVAHRPGAGGERDAAEVGRAVGVGCKVGLRALPNLLLLQLVAASGLGVATLRERELRVREVS